MCTPGFRLLPALYSLFLLFRMTGYAPVCLLPQETCSRGMFNVSGMGLSANVWALN